MVTVFLPKFLLCAAVSHTAEWFRVSKLQNYRFGGCVRYIVASHPTSNCCKTVKLMQSLCWK